MRHSNSSHAVCRLALFVLFLAVPLCAFAQDEAPSLGDLARKYRERKKDPHVAVSITDAKELFSELDTILAFASEDSGYARRTAVKRKLLSRNELDAMYRDAFLGTKDLDERVLNSELVMKKLGLFPQDFEFKKYFDRGGVTEGIAGLYRNDDKTMYLMNWVPIDSQRPVMAHELTHALQDQNFDLTRFMRVRGTSEEAATDMKVSGASGSEQRTARRAFIEGQAMLVLLDYRIQDFAKNVPALDASRYDRVMSVMQNLLENYDSSIVLKNAPPVLKEITNFPYREGLAFEIEAVRKSRPTAFAGMFARPPRSTFEILEPAAYFAGKHVPVVTIPDLSPVLKGKYLPYDTGVMGEFDVHVMAKEFGRENDIYTVAQKWNGGAYVVVRRPLPDGQQPTTNDLALVYVSRWRTHQAAARFAEIYRKALAKRVSVDSESAYETKCGDEPENCKGLFRGFKLATSEGPASFEIWPDHTLIIAQSFDEDTLAKLRPLLLKQTTTTASVSLDDELSSKLYKLPAFVALQERWATELSSQILRLTTEQLH